MNIRKLSPELAKKAQEELNEDDDRLQSDVTALRSWIETQEHLISRNDDQFLVTFLRRCNFNLEESQKRVDDFLTCKSNSPEIFKNRPVDTIVMENLKSGMVNIPPNPLPNNGPKLIVTHISKFDPKKHTLRDIMRVRFMLFELLAFENDAAGISGVELILDLKDCTFQQALSLNPSILRKAYFYQEKCIPLRINNIHVINMKKPLQSIVQLARSIASAEAVIPVLIHENESDLYKYIPQESLPAEYGGKNGSDEEFKEKWEKILLDHVDYFEKDALLGTNEKLRKKSGFSFQSFFGF